MTTGSPPSRDRGASAAPGAPPVVDAIRASAKLALWWVGLAAALFALHRLGDALPLPSASEALRYLVSTDPMVACFSLLRGVALVMAWYLVATTALGMLARFSHLPGLIGAVDAVTLPVVKKVLRGVACVSLATSIGAGSLGATGAVVLAPAAATAEASNPETANHPDERQATMRLVDPAGEPAPAPSSSPPEPRATASMRAIDPAGPVPGPSVASGDAASGDAASAPPITMRTVEPQATEPSPPSAGSTPAGGSTPEDKQGADAEQAFSQGQPPGADMVPSGDRSRSDGSDDGSPSKIDASSETEDHPDGQSEAPSSQTGEGHAPETWTISPGEHLWRVSQVTLFNRTGKPPTDTETLAYLHRLIDANRSRLAVPNNPDLVFPGQVFTLPPT